MADDDGPNSTSTGRFEPKTFLLEWTQPDRSKSPQYRIRRPFTYRDTGDVLYTVPAPAPTASNTPLSDGRYDATDLASIPPFLTWLVPKDGSHTPAALLHDALIGGEPGKHYTTTGPAPVEDRHADYLFREAMTDTGVPFLRRWLMWSAVALRSMTVNPKTGAKRVGRIVPIAVVVLAWAVLSSAMALDVPDLLDARRAVPWFGARPWWTEIWHHVAVVGVGTAVCSLVLGVALRSSRGFAAGFFAGVVIGFLGLPMAASLVGALGYFGLERLADRITGATRTGKRG